MSRRVYRYVWSLRLFMVSFNVLGLASPVYFGARVLLEASAQHGSLSPALVFGAIIHAVSLATVLILTANFFAEIATDRNGLYVQFLWRRLFVPWRDVVDIVEMKWRFFSSESPGWLVRTHAPTPFHRLYGLVYACSPRPSFTIHWGIGGCEKLVQRIQAHQREGCRRRPSG